MGIGSEMNFPPEVKELAEFIRECGGTLYAVGGCVRDTLLNRPVVDWDVEVFGLAPGLLRDILGKKFGGVSLVGDSHGVYTIPNVPWLQVGIPRRDRKSGRNHKDFEHTLDPDMSIADAGRRRDLKVNAMYISVLSGTIHDPHGGMYDLACRRLSAVDAETFAEDPLRMLRAVRFAAQLGFHLAPELRILITSMATAGVQRDLAPERVTIEMRKILMAAYPAVGLNLLHEVGLLPHFDMLARLRDVPQSPLHHPEGDVWTHTVMVVERMGAIVASNPLLPDDVKEALMWAALVHDIGKITHTETAKDGSVRSPGHEEAGAKLVPQFFETLPGVSNSIVGKVTELVRFHLAPAVYPAQNARRSAYVRVARELDGVGLTLQHLDLLRAADASGRTTSKAIEIRSGKRESDFEKACVKFGLYTEVNEIVAPNPIVHKGVVTGRYLLNKGHKAGKEMGMLIKRCLAYQDETGQTNPDVIYAACMAVRRE